jgi:hypothetical protein
MYGEPRKLPTPPRATTATTSISKHPSSPLFGHNMQLALLFFVLLFSFLSAYFGLFKMAASGSGKEKVANLSMVNIIV